MTQPIIRFEGVSKAFGTQTVLRDFSLDVEPGAFVSIIGRSGCGKTTVLKLVNGLLSPDTGRVLIRGRMWPESTRWPCAAASATPSRTWACFPT